MRYNAIVAAALSVLRLSEASVICIAETSNANKIRNGDFSNGLEGFNVAGSVEHIPGSGYEGCGPSNGAIQISAGTQDRGPRKRQTLTSSSVSTTIKNLVVGSPYTVQFVYNVLKNNKANNCLIHVTFANNNVGDTAYFPITSSLADDYTPFTQEIIPTVAKGTLKLSVTCGTGSAKVYVDNITVNKKVVATSSTTTTATTASQSSTSTTLSVSTTSTTSAASSSTPTSSSSTSANSSPSGTSFDSTILVIAPSADDAADGSAGLLAYGIPFKTLIVPKAGITLPVLNSTATYGNYGGIIVMSSVAYEYTAGWASALTQDQWNALYTYQTTFSVRMVRINEYPGTEFGTTTTSGGGCCTGSVDQLVSFTDISDFPTANLKINAGVSTSGLWHVPAVITNTTTTKQVAKFGTTTGWKTETVAAVINKFSGREQFVWFIGWGAVWSSTSNYLQHGHVHWITRGLFLGKRKTYLSCQIDDLQIATTLYYPTGVDDFKIATADLDAHVTWQTKFNTRLPAGSEFRLEMGHNGNGDFIAATQLDNKNVCKPVDAVYYDSPDSTALEFQKPLGTGVDIWPTPGYETFSWTKACAQLDPFASWFMVANNLNQFAHVSHTFTHLSLNNATYHDGSREIKFNQAWMSRIGIDQGTHFSAHGLIPPAITGTHNGDVIRAWMDNGIYYVVGDNTRPVLRNANNVYWPLTTTVAANGYDGLKIIPRFSTAIYFNCNTMDCTTKEWIATSAGSGDYFALLANSKASTIRNLLALQADPYMFHQANMHQTTVKSITIGTQTGKMSLLMSWTETMAQELMRLTNWPIKSLKHDDIAQYFMNRQTVDACNPKLSYSITRTGSGVSIQSVTVTANGNTCSAPIPVTIPSGATSASGGSVTSDVVGSEPPIQWVTLNGSPVTLTLSSPVTV